MCYVNKKKGGDYVTLYETLIINDAYSGQIIEQNKNGILIKTDYINEILTSKDIHFKIMREKDGITHYRGRPAKVNGDEIYIGQLTLLKKTQRRKEKRIPYFKEFCVNKLIIDGSIKELPQVIPFNSRDITGQGISLESKLRLPENFSFFLDFSFIRKYLSVQTTILRTEANGETYIYGCEFPYIAEYESDAIRQFLYKHQLDEIKKLKRR